MLMGGHLYPSTTSQGLAALATFISSVNIAGMRTVKEPRVRFLVETREANINQYKTNILIFKNLLMPLKNVSLR